jgi:Restriction endonuclease S subunits
MKIERYQAYKDSAVKWLGDVPEHWALQRLKDIAQITRGAILRPVDDPLYFDKNGEWYYLNISDATKCDKFLYTAKLKLSDLGSRKSARVLPDNIILTASATIGKPTINKVKVCVHDGFIPFKQIKCNIFYLYYFLLNSNIYTALGKSNTQKNIYLDEIKTVNIAVPPLTEQKSIAHYLDTKTAQIDRTIEILTQKATLYSNLKQSLINETVTRGLDKSVPMRDSGIEWLGEVPEHWKVDKIKRITNVKRGASPRPIDDPKYFDDVNGKYGWVRIEDVTRSSKYLLKTKEKLSSLGASKSVKMKPDTIFLSIAGSVGKPIITKINCCIHDGFVYFWGLKQNSDFMFYVFNCINIYAGIGKIGTQLNLNTEIVGGINIPIPPLCEQKEIADYLDTKTAQIDQIIQTINTQIEKLKELRKTLINDVVTGKIKVV